MSFIWEWFQSARIDTVAETADRATLNGSDAERRIAELEAEVDTLNLAVMAMWELFGKSNV